MHILSGYHLITARRSAVTRELPGHYPNVVLNTYVTSIVSGWQAPSETLLNKDRQKLEETVQRLVDDHLTKYPLLRSRTEYAVSLCFHVCY